jgi:hypothetical protein
MQTNWAKILLAASVVTSIMAGIALFGSANAQTAQPPAETEAVPLDAPSATLTNGTITARVYLPFAPDSFYRGTRFDRTGVIGSLRYGSQDFYGPWFDRVAPDVADFIFAPEGIVGGPSSSISGPAEEFAPVGFETAPTGGSFLKVGVGLLKKPDAKPYDHYRIYDIVDTGDHRVIKTKDSISFIQDITGAYRYVKTLRLIPGTTQMRIEHVLTNTGTAPLITNVYDHNFLKLSPGNGDDIVTLPFKPIPSRTPNPAMAKIEDNRIFYARPLVEKEVVSFLITGFGNDVRDYDLRVDNAKTGAGVRVTADQPLSRLNLWSIRSVMGLEPYIDINLPPGTTKSWTYTYTYTAPRP